MQPDTHTGILKPQDCFSDLYASLSSLNAKHHFSNWISCIHLIWFSLGPPLLSKLDQCFLLPKRPGKKKEKKKKNWIKLYSNVLSKIATHIHLDSTQVGRPSAELTNSVKQECLVTLSQVSHN